MTTRERIRELWESGVGSDAEIARRAGTSRQRVQQVLGPKRVRRLNVVAACQEIREELARPVTFVLDQARDERGFRHGTANAYQYHGCRCVVCREVPLERIAESREKYARGEHRPTHGKLSTYRVYGCRCDKCRAVNTEASRRRDAREKARRSA